MYRKDNCSSNYVPPHVPKRNDHAIFILHRMKHQSAFFFHLQGKPTKVVHASKDRYIATIAWKHVC